MPAFLKALIPISTRKYPARLLLAEELPLAVYAVKTRLDLLGTKTPLLQAVEMLAAEDQATIRQSQRVFAEAADKFRHDLYLGDIKDPVQRLATHEALMAAGYYARTTDFRASPVDGVRFVLSHYNFDVRRDRALVNTVHDSIMTHTETKEADALACELLMLERYLFGAKRLAPVGGKQWLMLGVELKEFRDEEQLRAVLEMPPVAANGNFKLEIRDEVSKTSQERWKIAHVSCLPEKEPQFAPQVEGTPAAPLAKLTTFDLRVLKPAPILPFWERVKQRALELWVGFFSFWILFWIVDEEVIAFTGLIWARYQQMKMLKEEAKRTGGRVYMSSTKLY